MRLILLGVVALGSLLLSACPGSKNVQCERNDNCDRLVGGVCHVAPSGNRWCAYPDPACQSGYRYSDLDVGDDLEGRCTQPQLKVMIGGSGSGTVSSIPEGITCSDGTCLGSFPEGTQVELKAAASEGAFLGWSDACRGQGACVVTMDSNQVVGALFGSPGQALWVTQLGGSRQDSASRLALDSQDNLIVVGHFSETITLPGGVVLNNAGRSGSLYVGYDLFVIKLAASTGSVVWAKRFGGTRDDRAFKVAVDQSDNIYLTGTFMGTVDFGGGALSAGAGLTDSKEFVLKLDTNGDYVWVRPFDRLAIAEIGVRGDAVVLASSFRGSVTVDTTTFNNAGDDDIIVLKLSAATGATTWVKHFGGGGSDVPRGTAIDSNNNVVLVGSFSGALDFGGGTLSAAASSSDMFLLKLSSDGAHLLSKRFGGPGNDNGNAVVVDSANGIVITGDFFGEVDFGCTNRLTSSQADIADIFIAKFTQAGACEWAQGFGGLGTLRFAPAITVNNGGDVAVAGYFCGAVSFGGRTLRAASECPATEVFGARFSRNGTHLNSVRAGGTGSDDAWGIAESSDGRFFISGSFDGFAEFGGEARTTAGGHDGFVAGFAPL
jgi:hypothetical protein